VTSGGMNLMGWSAMRMMREMVILWDGENDARNQEAIKNVQKKCHLVLIASRFLLGKIIF
jgi:hypothetical protein